MPVSSPINPHKAPKPKREAELSWLTPPSPTPFHVKVPSPLLLLCFSLISSITPLCFTTNILASVTSVMCCVLAAFTHLSREHAGYRSLRWSGMWLINIIRCDFPSGFLLSLIVFYSWIGNIDLFSVSTIIVYKRWRGSCALASYQL